MSQAEEDQPPVGREETRDGMRIVWDAPIPMDDGIVLRADVFRPMGKGRYPVIMSHGPYGKGLAFQEHYADAWTAMIERHPDVAAGSSNKYQNWEVVDPEKWVPEGYVVIRVDSRGAGRSPGVIDPWSPRETRDYHDCIEWAALQPWCTGKVGLNGISYYGINQWQVAGLRPPHLAAICVWEGCGDFYRDQTHHGGILSAMQINWFPRQVGHVQHGRGDNGPRSWVTGETVCGPATLSEEELRRNRVDLAAELLARPLDGSYYRDRSPVYERIQVPLLSAANWGGQGLHTRGNFEGFLRSGSAEKWLEVHGLEHWTEFYTDYGVGLQKRFFGHFLKGEDTGWSRQPRVLLQVRHPDRFAARAEAEWPPARTQWTKFYLDAEGGRLTDAPPAAPQAMRYEALGEGLTFLSGPLEVATEITGPVAAKLSVASATEDADLFVVLRVFTANMKEVTFQGAIDPHTPIAQGWLRASHRKLDPALSQPWQPYHAHDGKQPLIPGQPVALEVELWPTSIVVPAGHRIGFTVRGKDYVHPGGGGGRLSYMKNAFTGCGPFLHDDPRDRPEAVFGGTVTLHNEPGRACHVLLPVMPRAD